MVTVIHNDRHTFHNITAVEWVEHEITDDAIWISMAQWKKQSNVVSITLSLAVTRNKAYWEPNKIKQLNRW